MELAKELGKAPGFEYHDKLLPIHRYRRTVDELVYPILHCDWEWLEAQIYIYGMYNVGLMMVPPLILAA
jgi:ribonucleoside-diphosphate reductase alpha chain